MIDRSDDFTGKPEALDTTKDEVNKQSRVFNNKMEDKSGDKVKGIKEGVQTNKDAVNQQPVEQTQATFRHGVDRADFKTRGNDRQGAGHASRDGASTRLETGNNMGTVGDDNQRRSRGPSMFQKSLEGVSGLNTGRKIKIKIKSYDTKVLDQTVKKIADTLRKLGLVFSVPIPLPVDREFITVLKSPHVHKDARQVFERLEKKRIIEIPESKSTIAALNEMKHSNPSITIEAKSIDMRPGNKGVVNGN